MKLSRTLKIFSVIASLLIAINISAQENAIGNKPGSLELEQKDIEQLHKEMDDLCKQIKELKKLLEAEKDKGKS
jgi:hypothetical protein